jgi:D-glycero-alpha-D-manno-heptose 1-phosphate guanylyltransferase
MPELEIKDIDTIILCGGLGTRLKDIVKELPKPMVDIHGKPFLDLIVDYISSFGLCRFILCSGYKSEVIGEYYRRKNDGLEYVLSEEDVPLGTGGATVKSKNFIKSKVFLGLNGDSICQIDLKKFLSFHLAKKANISIALTSIDDPRDYGSIDLNEDQEITGFNEKSSVPSGSGLVNAGIYLFSHQSLDSFPLNKKISLEYDVFPAFVGNGLYGYVDPAPLFDIGTPQRLDTLKNYFLPEGEK